MDILSFFPDDLQLHIVDVGAMAVGGAEPYWPLVERGRCRVLGFDASPEECAALQKQRPEFTYLPYCIGDGSTQDLYVTANRMTTSLYPPNRQVLDRYAGLGEQVVVERVERVATVRLDDLTDMPFAPEYLKLDVQGAELQVLAGAERVLRGVVAAHVEVEFVELYEGQPLFADVDRFMRAQGFLMHHFHDPEGRALAGPMGASPLPGPSQLLWADAVYFRDPGTLVDLSPAMLTALAVVQHHLYGVRDGCAHTLGVLDRVDGTDRAREYVESETGAAASG